MLINYFFDLISFLRISVFRILSNLSLAAEAVAGSVEIINRDLLSDTRFIDI